MPAGEKRPNQLLAAASGAAGGEKELYAETRGMVLWGSVVKPYYPRSSPDWAPEVAECLWEVRVSTEDSRDIDGYGEGRAKPGPPHGGLKAAMTLGIPLYLCHQLGAIERSR